MRRLRHGLALIASLLLALALSATAPASPACACSCGIGSPQQMIDGATVIIEGTVLTIEPIATSDDRLVVVSVWRVYKGEVGSAVTFRIPPPNCIDTGVAVGRQMLVLSTRLGDGTLDTPGCGALHRTDSPGVKDLTAALGEGTRVVPSRFDVRYWSGSNTWTYRVLAVGAIALIVVVVTLVRSHRRMRH